MYDDIIDSINASLSLEELSNIAKQSLSMIYTKLESGGMYHPTCFVTSVGKNEYDVDMCFIDGRSSNTGMSYKDVFWL